MKHMVKIVLLVCTMLLSDSSAVFLVDVLLYCAKKFCEIYWDRD